VPWVDDDGRAVGVRTKLTVVFADDDPGMRTLFRTLLGLVETVDVVGEATDGDEAIDLVRREEPDLVLLDVNMPRLDGLDAAQVIRSMRPETHIVLHTAAPNQETRAVAGRLGIPLLDKVRFDDVIEAVTGHPASEVSTAAQPDPQIEAAVLAALTARRSQPMFLVLPNGEVPFYNVLAADLLGLPVPALPSTIDKLREHFDILRPDGSRMEVEDRLMYRAIAAQTPLSEIVVVDVGDRRTTCRAAAIPFFADDQRHVATAIYFEPVKNV
jgi:CheY-like chemotaxis protein